MRNKTSIIQYKYSAIQVLYNTSIYTNLACQLHRPDHFETNEKSNASVGQEFFPNFQAYRLCVLESVVLEFVNDLN